jgi:FkbH-like protein
MNLDSQSELQCVCLSDFNLSNLAAYLADPEDPPTVRTVPTEYGQVVPYLLDEQAECWQDKPHAAVVWTRPEAVSPNFARLMQREVATTEAVLADVDEYLDLLSRLQGRVGCVLVPTWTIASYDRGLGLLDLRPEIGIRAMLNQMNARLCERLAAEKSMFALDAERWLAQTRRPGFNAKLWYMAKIAFDNEVLKLAAEEIKAAIRAVRGETKKLVLLDLDGTLWKGVVGDVGWENLVLGGHDPEGEALVDFQRQLKALTRQGILLGVVSKNEETVALHAINNHPEMVLRQNDLAGWRINWNDKAENITELTAELNLGLQSVVFIDDNPVERDRIRHALPEVLVPEWPNDILLYPSSLAGMRCFDAPSLSAEDRQRSSFYSAEHNRRRDRVQMRSVDDWLKTLETVVTVEPLTAENLPRAAQLLNKTNQMNLTTRRMTEAELIQWSAIPGRCCCAIRVEDKFGTAGLTGLLSVESSEDRLTIADFVLSCRVMGRKVEETMLNIAVQHARREDLRTIVATYLPTPKNKPCLDFFRRSGFTEDQPSNTFTWSVSRDYPAPGNIKVAMPQASRLVT